MAVHCPVCGQTFQNDETRDVHKDHRQCLENPDFNVEGVTDYSSGSWLPKTLERSLKRNSGLMSTRSSSRAILDQILRTSTRL